MGPFPAASFNKTKEPVMAGSHSHTLVTFAGSQLSVVSCLKQRFPGLSPTASSLSQEVMAGVYLCPPHKTQPIGLLGLWHRVCRPWSSRTPMFLSFPSCPWSLHQCWGPHSLSVIFLSLTQSRVGSVCWLNG